MNHQSLDLSQLALDRSDTSMKRPRRTRWISRYVIPGGILLGFGSLLFYSIGQQLLPSTRVKVVPVVVRRGAVQQSGTELFQAAGWIEPRPTPVSIAALTAGVIEELLVVEGQAVSKGDAVAKLIQVDAGLAVKQAETQLSLREGELQQVMAEVEAAELRLKQPVHLQAQWAEANSLLAKTETEVAQLPFKIDAAQAAKDFAVSNLKRKQSIEDSIAGILLDQAQRDLRSAQATLSELENRGNNLEREVEALNKRTAALKSQLDLLVEEKRQVAEARGKVKAAMAMVQQAEIKLEKARLELDRTTVRAPIDGRILRLVASPGTRVMGLEQQAGQNSSTIAQMYDPTRLQVRADVRLEDVPLVVAGAPVEIRTASAIEPIRGKVLQSTSSANVQKNTLEVKVELLDPPGSVSPEMLVTATFLASTPADSVVVEARQKLLVPTKVIQENEDGKFVWKVTVGSQVKRQLVAVGRRQTDGLVEITQGLTPADKIVSAGFTGLRDGQSVEAYEEEQTNDNPSNEQ